MQYSFKNFINSPKKAAIISSILTCLLVVLIFNVFVLPRYSSKTVDIPQNPDRFNGGAVVVQDNNGILFMLDTEDKCVSRSIYHSGTWEPNINHAVKSLLNNGDRALFIGSHIGYHAIAGAKQVGPSGKVFAFEANPKTFKFLKINTLLNDLNNTVLYNKAVYSNNGFIEFHNIDNGNTGMSHITRLDEDKDSTIRVECVAIDSLEEISNISLIVMDIEGAENYAVEGMKNLISNSKNLVIIQEWSPAWMGDKEKYVRYFKSNGYKFARIRACGKLKIEDIDAAFLTSTKKQIDIIIAKDIESVKARILRKH